MLRTIIGFVALVSLSSTRCGGSPPPTQAPSGADTRRAETGSAVASLPRTSAEAPAASAPGEGNAAQPGPAARDLRPASEACGPFACFVFDSGAAALEFLVPEGPAALGVGEAHALSGSEHVTSTARRFADELLPTLQGRASHLVVELLNPDPRCETATREARRVQEPVTAPQSKNNQDDYVELGRRARELGIEPFVLSPTCDEYRAIAAAGDGAIDAMLSTIARVTSRMLRGALAKNHAAGRAALVVGYGGALHNDSAPDAAKAAWSYGPDLAAFTGGRYVELDLIVREFIKDTDAWRALPWYAHFDPHAHQGRWLVMRTGPRRYTLFFPSGSPSPLP